MKIRRIKIKNFKSIKEQDIKWISNVNMLYGFNNSGKSNMLKFIEMLFSRKLEKQKLAHSTEFDFEDDNEKFPNTDWWDGIIDRAPFIFRNMKRETPIEFEVWVDIPIKTLVEIDEKLILEMKGLYFNDEQVAAAKAQSDQLNVEAKAAGQGSEEAEVQSEFYRSISNANKSGEKDSVQFRFKGQITSLGEFDATMKLTEVGVYNHLIFDGEEYFVDATATTPFIHENKFQVFSGILSFLNDSVLFLDNDRYFTSESYENVYVSESIGPKNFKSWVHRFSLDPFSRDRLQSIIKEMSSFNPGGDAAEVRSEQNSPFSKGMEMIFGEIRDEINILFENSVSGSKILPIESYGTGIQQLFYLLFRVSLSRPKVLIIEELELNLSPKYQYKLLRHLLEKMIMPDEHPLSQIIFTTHSPMLCYNSDFVIFQASINENGESNFKRMSQKDVKDFYPAELAKVFN